MVVDLKLLLFLTARGLTSVAAWCEGSTPRVPAWAAYQARAGRALPDDYAEALAARAGVTAAEVRAILAPERVGARGELLTTDLRAAGR